ncbi:MAG: pyruvate formate lyase-activating protein, partial [Candidatus Zixiibacteriota bacterium]
PNHIDCCTEPVLKFIAENFSGRVIVNLMDQYRPCFQVTEDSEINRRITSEEFQRAVRRATDLGINFIT